MNLYYKIISDAIIKMKHGPGKDIWKFGIIISMSFPVMVLFMFIMAIVEKHITGVFYRLFFLERVFPAPIFGLFNFLILFVLPFVVFNYFFILYRNNYLKFVDESHYRNGKLYLKFFLVCVAPVFLTIVGLLTYKILVM